MSLAATYTVAASGSSLGYQWSRDGVAIQGATSSTYTTPPLAFTDSGALFTVSVSNSVGSVTSTPASLTVTARAPAPDDLRFQQVDAPSTVNGYGNGPPGIGSGIDGRLAQAFSSSIGTPINLSTGDCVPPPGIPGIGCTWFFEQYNLPEQLSSLGLSTYYGGDFFTSLLSDLQNNAIVAGKGSPPSASNSVVTSIDLEPANNLFGLSFIQSSRVNGFDMSVQTIDASDLQGTVSQEGSRGRVITAVSYNAGKVTYLSYGWAADTTTAYEVQVALASLTDVPAAATSLASKGYILTATGGSGPVDSFILVGTRVNGDTAARPFSAVVYAGKGEDVVTHMQQGYAIVGIVVNSTGGATYLMER